MRKSPKSRFSAPIFGIGALLVDQVLASMRSSVEDRSNYLIDASKAMDQISADEAAASDGDHSESLKALNALVESELALASGDPEGLQFAVADALDLSESETASTQTIAFDGFVAGETDKSILVAHADAAQANATDLPHPVLAQLSQATPQQPTDASVATAAEQAASLADGGDLSWSLVGGALAGLAVLSNDGNTAPTSAPVDKTGPMASISIADKILTVGEQTTITITFNELVKNFELSDLGAPNGVLSELRQSADDPLVWTAKFVPSASTEDLTNVVSLFGEYADLAGNTGASATSDNYIVATQLAGGTVADGYIDGATVFRDLDGDGIQGEGEASALTGAGGVFSGLGGFGGNIVAFGGTDISTGLKFAGVLKAPTGSEVINPLTTLVSAVVGDSTDKSPSDLADLVSAAEAKIASLLGIDSSLGSITQTDPIALIAAGGPDAQAALQMQLQAIQVANVLVTLSESMINSGVSTDANAASLLMSDALADLINNLSENGTLDLGNASVLNGLFTSVVSLASESGQVSAESLAQLQQVAGQASEALAAVNAKIDAIDLSTGIQGLINAVAAQLVIVGENGLLNALSSGETFSTENLDQLINDNLKNVKDVDGEGSGGNSGGGDSGGGNSGGGTSGGGTSGGGDEASDGTDGTWDISNANDPDAPSSALFDIQDGTVNLNTSLSALSAMGIDTITGESGTSVVVTGGYGSDAEISGLSFADGVDGDADLDVTLQLTDADTDGFGTVNLNTSLSALSTMGIDTIEAASGSDVGSVVITGGYGSDAEISGLSFADGVDGDADLDVTLQLTDADTDGFGTVNLNTSLSALATMGIDTIEAASGSGVGSVVITGGYGSDAEISGLSFADGVDGDADLDVTLQLTDDDQSDSGTVNLNTSLGALSAMGIDTITGVTGTSVVVTGGIGDLDLTETDLQFADGLDGENDLDVTLEMSNTEIGSVNLNTSLSALDDMGIDTIQLNTNLSNLAGMGYSTITADSSPSIVVAGGIGDLSLTEIVDLGLTFADETGVADLDVTLEMSTTGIGSINLNTSLSTLEDMGIDTIQLNTSLSDLVDLGYSSISADSSPAIVVAGGIGDLSLTEIVDLGLTFADETGVADLDVTLEMSATEIGSVNLNTSLSTLDDMGIDTIQLNTSLSNLVGLGYSSISADSSPSIVVTGGVGDLTLSELMDLGLNFADGGDDGSDLMVTLDIGGAESSLMLSTGDAENLRDMGIDFINGQDGLIDVDSFFT